MELGERYIKTVFAFFGITDFQSVSAENLDTSGTDVDAVLADAIEKAKQIALSF